MIISDTDSSTKPEKPDLEVPRRDGAKVNKGCDMELGFLENIAIFTSQAKGLKKRFSSSQTPFPRQLSDELSVKIPEAAGSHFPLNSQERKDEKHWG